MRRGAPPWVRFFVWLFLFQYFDERMMRMVKINGNVENVDGQKLTDYLDNSEYRPGTFVVEINEEIVHKEDYEGVILHDGDTVEIVQFMGGGC